MASSLFPLCFMHLGKVGGHAISRELFNRFDRKRVLNVSPWEMDAIPDENLKNYDLINGHWTGWQVDKLPEQRFLFSMLRDPISRVLSAYWFCREWTSHINSTNNSAMHLAKTLPLEEWIRSNDEQVVQIVDNYQTRHFGGDWRDITPVNDVFFSKALDRMNSFDLIGVYENYDASLQILCSKFSWLPWPSERKLNISVPVNERPPVSSSVRSFLAEKNTYDSALYEQARAVFDRTLRNELRHFVMLSRAVLRQETAPDVVSARKSEEKLPERVWLAFNQAIIGDGWQPRVEDGGPAYSWIGPTCQASLELVVQTVRDLQVKATLVGWIDDETVESIELRVAGETCQRTGFMRFPDADRPHITAVWIVPAAVANRCSSNLELVFHTARSAIIDYPGPNGLEPLMASVAISDVAVEPIHSTLRVADDVDRALWTLDKTYGRKTVEDRQRFDEAATILRSYHEKYPENPRGLFGVGWVEMALKRFELAAAHLHAAHSFFPPDFNQIASILAHRFAMIVTECAMNLLWTAGPQFSLIVQAEKLARVAIERNPQDPNAWYWVGETMCFQGRSEEALSYFQRAALENQAEHGERMNSTRLGLLHARLGESYIYSGKLQEAEQAFEIAQASNQLEGQFKSHYENVKATLRSGKTRRLLRFPTNISQFQNLPVLIKDHLYMDKDFPKILKKDSRVLTLGSCFAENIAIFLNKIGIQSNSLRSGEIVNSTYANRALLEWATDGISDDIAPEVGALFPQMFPQSHEEIRHLITTADVLVFTLGVAPCFFKKDSGQFTIVSPDIHTMHFLKVTKSRVTTVDENVKNIETICNLIWSINKNIHVVITVSPVPLRASFDYSSAIVADCVSKSTLRVSVDQAIKKMEEKNIHYWPAFEAVRWAGAYRPGSYGAEDGTTHHVSEATVQAITSGFAYAFGDDAIREHLTMAG